MELFVVPTLASICSKPSVGLTTWELNARLPEPRRIPSEHRRMFQIVRLALDDNGEVTARRPLQPCFELWEDAIAMAEFDASRLWGDYGCDEERDCWWAIDTRGRKYRFVIEQVRPTDIAA
jgi:hypothetical protein